MKQHKERYGIAKLAGITGVSRSGYYAWEKRTPSLRDKEEKKLAESGKRNIRRTLRQVRESPHMG